MLYKRIQQELVKRFLGKFPIVAVVGARQTGKSTLVSALLGDGRKYLSLDDPALIMLANENPMAFLTQDSRLTIDEIQKCPPLFNSLKQLVDKERKAGQFLITGSANPTMYKKITETLSGRIVFIDLFPLTLFEISNHKTSRVIEIITAGTPKRCWEVLNSIKPRSIPLSEAVFRGGLPPGWLEKDDVDRNEWFKAYVRTYLERDVRDLSRIQNLYDYQKYIALLAFRCGQILNLYSVAKDSGISYTTSRHFFDLVLTSYQAFLIQPYYRNIGKRLIKSPKILWNDTGLAAHLQGLNTWEDAGRLGRSPFLVENKIAIELKALLSAFLPLAKLWYWRTCAGAEVDLVVEHRGQLIPIEIKWKERITTKDALGLASFMGDFKTEAPWGIILYGGRNLFRLQDNIFVVPFKQFLS